MKRLVLPTTPVLAMIWSQILLWKTSTSRNFLQLSDPTTSAIHVSAGCVLYPSLDLDRMVLIFIILFIFYYFIQSNYLNITAQNGGQFQNNPVKVLNKNRVILISGHSLGDLPIDILSFALIYVAFQGWQMLMLIIGRRYGVDPGAVGRIGRLPGPGD